MNGNILSSTYGGLFQSFNIGIITQAFSLLRCYSHPNGLKSLTVSADVICGKDKWFSMLVIAVPCILLFVVGYVILISYAIIQAPLRFELLSFRQRWKFLFIKFRPTYWFWSLPLFAKAVLLSLTAVIFEHGSLQFIWLTLTTSLYSFGSCTTSPWRHEWVSACDVVAGYFLISLFVMLSTDFDLLVLPIIITSVPFVVVACVIASKIYELSRWEALKLVTKKKIEESFSTLQGMRIDEAGFNQLMELPPADIWILRSSASILSREIDGIFQTGTLQRLSSKPREDKVKSKAMSSRIVEV